MTVDDSRPHAEEAVARALALVTAFADVDAFGSMASVSPEDVPEPARSLLHHHGHMTVTMERHHTAPVTLRVVAERDDEAGRYAREILLARPDGAVVQAGIVRIDLAAVGAAPAAAIRERSAPLGRILLAAGLLCEVHQVDLLTIVPGPHLRSLVGDFSPLHGRVAEISVGGRPAIELLEIVVPAPTTP